MQKLISEARLSQKHTTIKIEEKDFIGSLKNAQDGDLHIIPFEISNIDDIFKYLEVENKSFLFVSDSGKENLLS